MNRKFTNYLVTRAFGLESALLSIFGVSLVLLFNPPKCVYSEQVYYVGIAYMWTDSKQPIVASNKTP